MHFRPGVVGGHCIGVDPCYLSYKAEKIGCHPDVILAGRRINDGMGKYVAEVCVKHLINADKHGKGARVGLLGFIFKENVPDIAIPAWWISLPISRSTASLLVHDPEADALKLCTSMGRIFCP